MLRSLTTVAILIALSLSAVPLAAQEGLSEDELALVQRYSDALFAGLDYDSYSTVFNTSTNQVVEVYNEGVLLVGQVSAEETQGTSTVIHGDNPSGIQTITQTTSDDDGTRTIEVELRYVDGIVYAAGRYIEGIGTLVFPDGFAEIDPEADPVFAEFEVQEFVDEVLGQIDESEPLNDPDVLASIVDTVTSTPGELDSEVVEIITLTILSRKLVDATLQHDPEALGDPSQRILYENVSDESLTTIELYVDSQGRALQSEVQSTIEILDFQANLIYTDQPDSVTLNFLITQNESGRVTQINADLPAITAP